MKKTAVFMSAIIVGAMALPTAANAKNDYPSFPTRPKDIEFTDLPEEEQQAYLEGVESYRTALCTAYQNGEYDWDFNLDGETDVMDAYYILHYYSELAVNTKRDEFIFITDYTTKEYTACSINDEMRAKIAEEADINGDNRVRPDDISQMLYVLYNAKLKGDVNTDGKLDARDASDMLKFYSNNSVNIQSDYITEKNMEYLGDLNDDGKVDANDTSYALAEYSRLATE
ncbi:MAG: hypothetical protein IKP78_02875 [Ruminococcus sp.]|nr:hypothetical protein [Ruminococcus sp.]